MINLFSSPLMCPNSGVPAYLLVNATGLEFPGRLVKLDMLSLTGDVLMEVPVVYDASHPNLYNISAFCTS